MDRLGFRVIDTETGEYLSPTEINQAHLYMRHDGTLVRFEPYEYNGEVIPYVREPRDLMIVGLGKDRGRRQVEGASDAIHQRKTATG